MTMIYTDFKNYPHGFRRSGDFSIKESDRLERYGHLFQQLLAGARKPANDQEKTFLNQLTGKSESTAPEVLAWLKYQKKISESKQYFPLCSTPTDEEVAVKKSSAAGEDSDDDADISVDEVDPMEDDGDDLEIEEA